MQAAVSPVQSATHKVAFSASSEVSMITSPHPKTILFSFFFQTKKKQERKERNKAKVQGAVVLVFIVHSSFIPSLSSEPASSSSLYLLYLC